MTNEIDRDTRGSLAESVPEPGKENLEGIERFGKRVHRPGWVVVCAILIALVSLLWIWNGIDMLSDMSRINWTDWAASLEVDAGFLKGWYAGQSYLSLAAGILLLVADVGIWTMKKWGTIVYVLIAALLVFGQITAISQTQAELGQLVFVAGLILIGFGLIWLWRGGELT